MATMKHDIPIVGIIPHTGKGYTVEFKPEGSCTRSTLTGYRPFPFDRYKVPVIDLTEDLRAWEFIRLQFREIDAGIDTPQRKLEIAREMGLKIINS